MELQQILEDPPNGLFVVDLSKIPKPTRTMTLCPCLLFLNLTSRANVEEICTALHHVMRQLLALVALISKKTSAW